MSERTIIVGGPHENAREWCRANGVQPYAKTTLILTTPVAVRGLVITPEDRVVWHQDTNDDLRTAVRVAQAKGMRR